MNLLLESILALTFLYVLLSLLVSFLSESIASLLRRREKTLKTSIDKLLNDDLNKNYGVLLYEHPLIFNLRRSEKRFPTYMSSEIFAKTLIEIIKDEVEIPELKRTTSGEFMEEKPEFPCEIDAFQAGVNSMYRSDLKRQLESFLAESNGNIDFLKRSIEKWFNEYQTRVSEWYQKKTKTQIFIVSALTVIILNFDSIHVFKQVQSDEKLRATLIVAAESMAERESIQGFSERNLENSKVDRTSLKEVLDSLNTYKNNLYNSDLPIGWGCPDSDIEEPEFIKCAINNVANGNQGFGISTFIGWLLSTIALSFGAPFWFDLMKKIVNIKGITKGS